MEKTFKEREWADGLLTIIQTNNKHCKPRVELFLLPNCQFFQYTSWICFGSEAIASVYPKRAKRRTTSWSKTWIICSKNSGTSPARSCTFRRRSTRLSEPFWCTTRHVRIRIGAKPRCKSSSRNRKTSCPVRKRTSLKSGQSDMAKRLPGREQI